MTRRKLVRMVRSHRLDRYRGRGSGKMADNRVRFRCYRCNQLLGVPRKRVGTVVHCPKCQAELEVPGSAQSPTREEIESRTGHEASPLAGLVDLGSDASVATLDRIAAAIPEDLIALRPEDIRVEAGFAGLVVTAAEPPASPAHATSFDPIEQWSMVEAGPSPVHVPVEIPAETPTSPADDPIQLPISVPPPIPAVTSGPEVVLPPIAIEPPTIRPVATEPHHVQQVVLHPSVVLAWSLTALMAIPLAFIAGLMIGHFLWKHP